MRLRFVLATASLLAVSCSAAFADDLFTLVSGNGKVNISFTAPGMPSVIPGSDYFTLEGISVDINGTTTTDDNLFFYTRDGKDSGGLAIEDGTSTTYFVDDYGRKLFTGTLADPTFITGGPFSLRRAGDGTYNNNFKLDITNETAAVTPEPSSFILLGTGLLGVVGIVRRRLVREGGAALSV